MNRMDNHDNIVLHGKFSLNANQTKVYDVELTKEKILYRDVNIKNSKWIGSIDLQDVTGCQIVSGQETVSSPFCQCTRSVVRDMQESFFAVYACPKSANKLFSQTFHRKHIKLLFGVSQYSDFVANQRICKTWRKNILHLSGCMSYLKTEDLENCEPQPQRKMLVLINPCSGPGKARQIFENGVATMLEEADILYKMVITDHAGHASEIMKTLDLSEWYGVVIVSGDGLIYETINGLMNRPDWETAINFPVGCIPGGSGNAMSLNINYQAGEPLDLSPVLHSTFVLIKHKVIPMDLVLVQLLDRQIYSFLSVTWGLIADIDYESERLRMLGATRFTLYFIKRIVNLRKYKAKISFLPVTKYEPKSKQIKNSSEVFTKPRRFTMINRHSTQCNISSSVCENGVQGVYKTMSSSDSIQRQRSVSMPAMKNIANTTAFKQNGHVPNYDGEDNTVFELHDGDVINMENPDLQNASVEENEDNASVGSENAFEETVHTLHNDGSPPQSPLLAPLDKDVPSNWVTIEDEFITACALYQPYLGPDNLAAPESRLNDGYIHLMFVRAGVPKAALVNLFLSFETGDHINSPHVEVVKVLAFRLEPAGDEGNIMVDGEHVEYGPVQGQVLPGIARVMGVQ